MCELFFQKQIIDLWILRHFLCADHPHPWCVLCLVWGDLFEETEILQKALLGKSYFKKYYYFIVIPVL